MHKNSIEFPIQCPEGILSMVKCIYVATALTYIANCHIVL